MKAKQILTSMLIIALLIAGALPLINSCKNNDKPSTNNGIGENSVPAPKNLGYAILSVFPHDTGSFTQGLAFYKGELYEGTGEYGRSKLQQVDLKTGKILRQIPIPDKYFGEGITILNDTIYQLTWKEKTVFAWSLKDFKKLKEFTINTEGWGITNDGKSLIVTDGGSNLYFYDPSTFRLLRTQGVTDGGNLAFNLNEIEYADGFIYANQWQYPYILKIDQNGQVVAKSDLTEVWNRVKAKDPASDVPNGIAYDTATKKMYVTGKRWPELYEIQFSN
jgi:glutaminyl-peptide cyclotransferase